MILTAIFLASCCVMYGESVEWKEKNMENNLSPEPGNEKTRCVDLDDEFCKSNQDFTNIFPGHTLKKKVSGYSYGGIPRNTKLIPVYQSLYQCPCFCKMDYTLMDLGRRYFPRYLQTGVCKPDSCGNHQRCIEKKYKVAVIKQKDFSDQDIPETRGLPQSLQDAWLSETVAVSIACECVPIM